MAILALADVQCFKGDSSNLVDMPVIRSGRQTCISYQVMSWISRESLTESKLFCTQEV